MSADNWAICPKCRELAEHKKEVLGDKVSRAYGEVSPEEYLDLVKKLNEPIEQDRTLREDYEIGIRKTAEFYVRYKAACGVCGFSYAYKYDQPITV